MSENIKLDDIYNSVEALIDLDPKPETEKGKELKMLVFLLMKLEELEKQNEELIETLKDNIETMKYALSYVEKLGLSIEDDLFDSIERSEEIIK